MDRPIVIIMVDGFDPEYIQACNIPNIDEVCSRGFLKIGLSMMPSVTNVNNVSLVTGLYPESHGINCNYWLNSETGRETYMESADFILAETLFQKANRLGKHTLMVSSKDKLRTLIGAHATVGFSSEEPLEEVVSVVGPPPPIYSLEVNGWIMQAADHLMSESCFDVVYIATTDYAMHTFPPDHPESQRHMTILDDYHRRAPFPPPRRHPPPHRRPRHVIQGAHARPQGHPRGPWHRLQPRTHHQGPLRAAALQSRRLHLRLLWMTKM